MVIRMELVPVQMDIIPMGYLYQLLVALQASSVYFHVRIFFSSSSPSESTRLFIKRMV